MASRLRLNLVADFVWVAHRDGLGGGQVRVVGGHAGCVDRVGVGRPGWVIGPFVRMNRWLGGRV